MEHRWNARQAVDCDVVIYHQNLPVARCSTINLSPQGVLLAPTALDVKLNSPVDVEFNVAGRQVSKRYRLPAQVVHHSAEGTGCMFRANQPQAQALIKELIESIRNVDKRRTPGAAKV